jgi:hypothetical protein
VPDGVAFSFTVPMGAAPTPVAAPEEIRRSRYEAQLAALMANLNGQGTTDLPFPPREPSDSRKPAPE